MHELTNLIPIIILTLGYYFRRELINIFINNFGERFLDTFILGKIAVDHLVNIKNKHVVSPAQFILWRVWKVIDNRAIKLLEFELEYTSRLLSLSLENLMLPWDNSTYLLEYFWNEQKQDETPITIEEVSITETGLSKNSSNPGFCGPSNLRFCGPFIIPVISLQLASPLHTDGSWICDSPEKFLFRETSIESKKIHSVASDFCVSKLNSVASDFCVSKLKKRLEAYAGPYQSFYYQTHFEVNGDLLFYDNGIPMLREGESITVEDSLLEDTLVFSRNVSSQICDDHKSSV